MEENIPKSRQMLPGFYDRPKKKEADKKENQLIETKSLIKTKSIFKFDPYKKEE